MDHIKKQILAVDDDLITLKLLHFLLSKEYDIILKQSVPEALSWLEEGNAPSLILSDLEMPVIDGRTFIRNLKISGFYNNTPVILISGAENLEMIVDQMPFQAERFFKKPFNPAELKMSISAVLTRDGSSSN